MPGRIFPRRSRCQARHDGQAHEASVPKASGDLPAFHSARFLLQATSLPIWAAAQQSGFRSLRQFNTLFRRHYEVSPSVFRRDANTRKEHPGPEGSADPAITVFLPYHPPCNWRSFAAFQIPRLIPGTETLAHGTYTRRLHSALREFFGRKKPESSEIPTTHEPVFVSAEYQSESHRFRIEIPGLYADHVLNILHQYRRFLDSDAHVSGIDAHLKGDPILKPLVETQPGTRLAGAWDSFEVAVRAVIGQQISVRAAGTLLRRLIDRCGASDGGFLSPGRILSSDLTAIGLPESRCEALAALAEEAMAVFPGTRRIVEQEE